MFQTKEEILKDILALEKPKCPHCHKEMNLWAVPEVNFSDGLGWGTPYLFVCFNDECPSYKKAWDDIEKNYAHKSSYRCINYPKTNTFEYMPVFSKYGGKGQIYDDEAIKKEEEYKEAIKNGFCALAEFYRNKDWDYILEIARDALQPSKVRIKALDMLGDIAGFEALEVLINHRFPNAVIQKKADETIDKMHEKFFTKLCPYCAEIIKKKAKICKHCKKEL